MPSWPRAAAVRPGHPGRHRGLAGPDHGGVLGDKQAIQLGIRPAYVHLGYTSIHDTGQIYVPFINWSLFAFVVVAVVFFGSSSKLARGWHGGHHRHDHHHGDDLLRHPPRLALSAAAVRAGHGFLRDRRHLPGLQPEGAGRLVPAADRHLDVHDDADVEARAPPPVREAARGCHRPARLRSRFISPPTRVVGTAVFLSAEQGITPNALLHNLKHNKVLHEQNLFVSVRHHEVPWISFDKRVELEALGNDCWQVVLHFGFKNEPDVPEARQAAGRARRGAGRHETSYFLSRDIDPPHRFRYGAVGEKLFAGDAPQCRGGRRLPCTCPRTVVELGSKVEI